MPRHHAVLVHNQLSSILKSGLLKAPPPAYSALLNYPPAPTPLRQRTQRPKFDLPVSLRSGSTPDSSSSRYRKVVRTCKPLPIVYAEHDRLRKAFYRDHPFEAYRPVSLVEVADDLSARTLAEPVRRIQADGTLAGPSDLVGPEHWTELRQRTLVPSAEDCVNFAYALYQHHPAGYSLNGAYQVAVSQFRTLRFEHHISTSFARQEAEFFGAQWSQDLLTQQLKNQDRWIKDRDGMDNLKSIQDPLGARATPVLPRTSTGSMLEGNYMVRPPVRKEETFQDGKSYLKEVLRKSKRLEAIQV
ncbi:hypothetical protein CROQUDRAFT_54857 [Cronartium quercuum f. sp. fusiforme G11]|uniref:Small ribosomal subunit protein mS23 n=1 Tax=Cronartium quercuum f. sp. fusiforme G11 TaxID=708437 RepID=A0A9P6N569_9BASI|nr:hypothetical protein CROQUDRAFT_54857 [Cronartium quercuum f. sp. fusiforme G11]